MNTLLKFINHIGVPFTKNKKKKVIKIKLLLCFIALLVVLS